MPASPQFLLPLENRRADRFENYVAGPNAPVVAALRELLDAGGGWAFVRGGEGTGKTHLLNALCNAAAERQLAAFYIAPVTQPQSAAEGLSGLESYPLVCIDDVDRIAGNAAWEEALFHCLNRLRARSTRLVLSSTRPLAAIAFGLPDLGSRLAWGLRLQLEPLDDRDKGEVLDRRARSLGLELPAEVRDYLLRRSSRNLARLLDNLEAVRIAALSGKRRLTVPLARSVLRGR